MNICFKGTCTCFMDSFLSRNHTECCELHDERYTSKEYTRFTSDMQFLNCLKKKSYKPLAYTMFLMVRIFGWYFWKKAEESVVKNEEVSKAILEINELEEHFADESNHYLYKKRDDNSLVCYMCCSFEIVDKDKTLLIGSCGDGIVYDLDLKTISVEEN